MLLEFSVENYRSFYRKMTLYLRAQGLSEEAKDNVVKVSGYNVLKTLAVYGANSSGKSNLVKALQTMRSCVLSSVKLNDNDALPYDPFLLFKGNEKNPTFFELVFLKDNVRFRYGFTYSDSKIIEEWLFQQSTIRSKEQVLFIRNEEGIGVDEKNFPEGIGNEIITNDNRLFLSLCQQLGGGISKQIISFFQSDIHVLSGLNNQEYSGYSKKLFYQNDELSQKVMSFFKKLQLGFEGILVHEEEIVIPDDFPEGFKSILIKEIKGKRIIKVDSVHNKYDSKGKVCDSVPFSFEDRESSGTKQLFDLFGPILDTLRNGSVLIIDELDAKMHPLISQYIIRLFNNIETNPNNAQLAFTTHDTHLLSQKMLRRDQIWFTEKDGLEQTDLFNLMDIVLPDGTKPRNDSNYEKNYIAGRYGAIPYMIND